jgi:hypothetical protein
MWPFFTVDIEATNLCGQNCSFCPRDSIIRPMGMMALKTFEHIAVQLAKLSSRITLCGMGNPLLNPELEKMIQLYKQLNAEKIGVTIQAPALDDIAIDRLITADPDFIEISFPTIAHATFEKIYPGESFEQCVTKVEQFICTRKNPRGIIINGIKTANDKTTAEEFTKFWETKGLLARFFDCHSRGGNLKNETLCSTPGTRIDSCGLFAAHSFVTWEGKLLACCHDLSGETQIADLLEESIIDAGEKKNRILAGGMPFKICKNCNEKAALRPIPPGNYPVTKNQRRKYLKKLAKNSK